MFNDMSMVKKPKKITKVTQEIIVNGFQNPYPYSTSTVQMDYLSNNDLNDANGVNIKIPPVQNVESIKLKFKFPVPTNAKVISAAKNNNSFSYTYSTFGKRTITIPDGNYTPRDLRVIFETLFFADHTLAKNAFGESKTPISVKYNKIDNKMYFASTETFSIDFSEGYLYKVIGYENKEYNASGFTKMALYQKFPHDGFSANPFRLESEGGTPESIFASMIEPPELNSICLYNYDNILIQLRAGSEDLNQSYVCIKDSERMKEEGATNSQQISNTFGHYVLGIQNSNGIISGATPAVKSKHGLMDIDRLNVKFRYQNGEVVEFGKNSKDFNFLFELTVMSYEPVFNIKPSKK